LIAKFALNHSRFFLDPGLTVSMYVLNSSGPLFRNNPKLRRAVNLALDRSQLVRPPAIGAATDQYLPPNVPGFKQRAIYPSRNIDRARALAAGSLRGGKALLYVPDVSVARLAAQGVQLQLEELGLEIEIRPFGEHATASAYLGRLGPDADEPWDLGLVLWTPDFVDPAAYINRLLDGQHAGGTNLARFDEPPYNALMKQASRLQGGARAKAYAELDLRLARDAAPLLPIAVLNEVTLVSARVGCMLRRPGLVLTTVCLKQ
jgi:ABC-type oligopeptide transport system substrate-binding subunit